MELREQRGLDAVAGLVVSLKPIAKRLDHVIGHDAEIVPFWSRICGEADSRRG
jgi:hypothetical protein